MENFEQRFNKLPDFFKEHLAKNQKFSDQDKNFQIEVYESAALIGKRFKTEKEIDSFKEAITPNPIKYDSLAEAGAFYSQGAKLLEEVYPENLEHNISRRAILSSVDLAKTYVQLEKKLAMQLAAEKAAERAKQKSIKAKFKRVRAEIKSKLPKVDTDRVVERVNEVFNKPALEEENLNLAFTIKDREY